jgi:hypothetical protein
MVGTARSSDGVGLSESLPESEIVWMDGDSTIKLLTDRSHSRPNPELSIIYDTHFHKLYIA